MGRRKKRKKKNKKRPLLTEEVVSGVTERLLEAYSEMVESRRNELLVVAETRYVYVGRRARPGWLARLLGGREAAEREPEPLFRLRYTGDSEAWELQMFKWSTENWDSSGDFMFWGGTPEECLEAAVSVYRG